MKETIAVLRTMYRTRKIFLTSCFTAGLVVLSGKIITDVCPPQIEMSPQEWRKQQLLDIDRGLIVCGRAQKTDETCFNGLEEKRHTIDSEYKERELNDHNSLLPWIAIAGMITILGYGIQERRGDSS